MRTSDALRSGPVIVVTAALALAACGGGGDSTTVAGDSVPTTAPAVTEPASTEPPVTEPPVAEPRCGVKQGDGEYDDIACDQPHDAEFAGLVAGPTEPASDDELAEQVKLLQLCGDSVAALSGRPNELFGVEVGVVGAADPGDPPPAELECWAEVTSPGVLSASMVGSDIQTALGDYVLISELDPGTCYLYADPDGFDIALIASCDDPDVEQLFATATVSSETSADQEALSDEAFDLCDAAFAEVDFETLSNLISVIYPLDYNRLAFDRRTVLCVSPQPDADVATDEVSSLEAPCAGTADENFPPIDCAEPHASEYIGGVAPPVDTLPVDEDEAATLGFAACTAPVGEFLGRSMTQSGISVGFLIDAVPGGPITGDIDCFATTNIPDGLVGSIAELGLEGALNNVSLIPDQDPGTCFLLGSDANYSLGEIVGCDDPDALMFIGNFELEDGPFPGNDAIRALRGDRCRELLAANGLSADPASVSGTFPTEQNWNDFGRRTVSCDATPI
jgi:hypothetical protein